MAARRSGPPAAELSLPHTLPYESMPNVSLAGLPAGSTRLRVSTRPGLFYSDSVRPRFGSFGPGAVTTLRCADLHRHP